MAGPRSSGGALYRYGPKSRPSSPQPPEPLPLAGCRSPGFGSPMGCDEQCSPRTCSDQGISEPRQGVEPWTYALRVAVDASPSVVGCRRASLEQGVCRRLSLSVAGCRESPWVFLWVGMRATRGGTDARRLGPQSRRRCCGWLNVRTGQHNKSQESARNIASQFPELVSLAACLRI